MELNKPVTWEKLLHSFSIEDFTLRKTVFGQRPSCESWYCVSVVLMRSTLSYPSKIHLVNKNRYQTLCVFMWAWICGHRVMGWIFVWLAHLSLRSGCKATGPTMTPEPIKWNINQISIPILVSVSLCAHAWLSELYKENIVIYNVKRAISNCVCACVYMYVKLSVKEMVEKQCVSIQRETKPLFSQYISHNKHKHSTVL